MLVKYYKNNDYTYSSRRRYKNFNLEPFSTEIQKSILLGDGAFTSIKTSSNNICDYVLIDDTRWFVNYYKYLNGGQVELFLQRDVVGEFGIDNCFGKIERGYTDTILKNRKELNLNQILKQRKPIKPQTYTYGSYSTNNHENELWGILYLSKPSDGNKVSVNIPSFSLTVSDLEYINTTTFNEDYINDELKFVLYIKEEYENENEEIYKTYRPNKCTIYLSNNNNSLSIKDIVIEKPSSGINYDIRLNTYDPYDSFIRGDASRAFIEKEFIKLIQRSSVIELPQVINTNPYNKFYNDAIVEYNNEFYRYNITTEEETLFGSFDVNSFINETGFSVSSPTLLSFNYNSKQYVIDVYLADKLLNTFFNGTYLNCTLIKKTLTPYKLSPSEAGVLEISSDIELIDEPYFVLATPLYNCNVYNDNNNWNITKNVAFDVFNSVIQALSGENALLVDAQIYPYCPDLSNLNTDFNGRHPFFNVASNNFYRDCQVSISEYIDEDIKKQYIERQFAIISPEQSDKNIFDFYDYYKTKQNIKVRIKTALKPFSIISSCVIIPEPGSLKNMTYDSSLIGCQPSSSGFEVSISTNAFEQYVRNNSNYQNIFNKNQEYLKKQQDVERVNEKVSGVVNTISATAMGAIGGASIGEAFGPIGKAVGTGVGAITAGATVGTAMALQYKANEELRNYEYNLQQELFDLDIGTIKNIPNQISRISSFNEIILNDFWYVIEVYECSEPEKIIVDNFINSYSYGIGVFDFFVNYFLDGWFLRGNVITSNLTVNLHNLLVKELKGGIYLYG